MSDERRIRIQPPAPVQRPDAALDDAQHTRPVTAETPVVAPAHLVRRRRAERTAAAAEATAADLFPTSADQPKSSVGSTETATWPAAPAASVGAPDAGGTAAPTRRRRGRSEGRRRGFALQAVGAAAGVALLTFGGATLLGGDELDGRPGSPSGAAWTTPDRGTQSASRSAQRPVLPGTGTPTTDSGAATDDDAAADVDSQTSDGQSTTSAPSPSSAAPDTGEGSAAPSPSSTSSAPSSSTSATAPPSAEPTGSPTEDPEKTKGPPPGRGKDGEPEPTEEPTEDPGLCVLWLCP